MINDNELRIGNLVRNESGETLLVKNIMTHFCKVIMPDGKHRRFKYEDLYPLDIDEYELRMLGFTPVYDLWEIGSFRLEEFDFIDRKEWYLIHYDSTFTEIRAKSIHNLQNLYLAITQKELDYKPLI